MTFCASQPFQPSNWTRVDAYSEDRNGAPWGFFALGQNTIIHWRTDNNGSAPRQRVIFIAYDRQPDASFVGGAWTQIDAYSEDKAASPWGLFALGKNTVIHWRTDNVGSTPRARAIFMPYTRQADGSFRSGRWVSVDAYSEDKRTAPWGLFGMGPNTIIHWRTDNEGSAPRQRALFMPYVGQPDGSFRTGAWVKIDSYSEDKKAAPWGFFALGAKSVVHWRTDNSDGKPQQLAQLMLYDQQSDGTFAPGPWTRIRDYVEDTQGAPWGLFALGSNTVIHWRTDNGSEARLTGLFREYRLQADGQLAPGVWNGIDGRYAEDDNAAPWGLLGLGENDVVHWRTDNEGNIPRRWAIFRSYGRK